MTIDTISNLGTGSQIFASIVGTDAQFRSVLGGAGISTVQNTNDITVSINPTAAINWTGQAKFLGATVEAIPPVTAWSGDPPTYSGKFSRTAPAGGSNPQAALIVDCTTNATSTSFEWTQLNDLENYAAAGENTAIYCKANRHSSGATWAGVFEARNLGTSYTNNLYGLEIDLCSDGMDPNQNQQGIAIFYAAQTNPGSSGPSTKQTNGILIFPTFCGRNHLYNGVHVFGDVDHVFAADLNTGQSAFYATGTYTAAAIDVSGVTASTAYLFHGKDDIPLALSSTANTAKIRYSSSANEIQFVTGTTTRFGIPMNASTSYVWSFSSGTAVSFTASAGFATPETMAGYLKVMIDGNPYKLAFYNN